MFICLSCLYKGEDKDVMFVLTNRYNAMLLECRYDDGNIEIITRAHGNVQVRTSLALYFT